jgi:hypothetical protein
LARCAAIKPNGERCKAEAMADAEWCWSHHPDYEQACQRRASKGGKRGGRGRPQAELNTIKRRLLDLTDDMLSGAVDKGVAAVASQVLNVYLQAASVELKVKEQLELLDRLEEVERRLQVNQQKGTRAW